MHAESHRQTITQQQSLYFMVINRDLKQAICSLFEVHTDEGGVQRIVTPIEYPGSNDQIVITGYRRNC